MNEGKDYYGPWLCIGDFNMILSLSEKFCGRLFACSSYDPFLSFLDSFGLVDLGFSGNPFTWSNKHQDHHHIKEHLDLGIANSQWIHLFPHFAMHHLPVQTLDHNHILLNTAPSNLSLSCPLDLKNFELLMLHVILLSLVLGLNIFMALLLLFSQRN